MQAAGMKHGVAVIERALAAVLARFQLALASGTPCHAYLYDAYQLSLLFGEREFLARDETDTREDP